MTEQLHTAPEDADDMAEERKGDPGEAKSEDAPFKPIPRDRAPCQPHRKFATVDAGPRVAERKREGFIERGDSVNHIMIMTVR